MSASNQSSLIIEVRNLSKIYQTYSSPRHRLIELLSAGRRRYAHEIRALDDVSLSLERGSRLGIVGHNGSGKSTLLKLLSGVLTPSMGTVRVSGRISALLELGAGFNPDLPGRENIRQFCLLHGMRGGEVDEALPQIIAFSELRDAIEQPVKTYSSGMAVRLGFSCAVYVQPEILIVDEALSVGDAYFQNKCLHKIKSLLDAGTTFIYVTHAPDSIRSLCNQALWLDKGQVRKQGGSTEVGAAYQSDVFARMSQAGRHDEQVSAPSCQKKPRAEAEEVRLRRQAFAERVEPLRTGTGEARIVEVQVLDDQGVLTDRLSFGGRCTVRVFYQLERLLVGNFSVALGVTDSSGKQLMHFNAADKNIRISESDLGKLKVVEFTFMNPLCPGEYGLICGISDFTPNPTNVGQLLVGGVVDHCVGGARFAIEYPRASENMNVWGVVYTTSAIAVFDAV